MKIHSVETIVRYQVTFSPRETKLLRRRPKWANIISVASSKTKGGAWWGCAQLTKSQISEICDILGINAREFMASQNPHKQPLQQPTVI